MGFSAAQVEQLLRPINAKRVLKDGKSKSHVSQQDVRAHLIRTFGFGNFDVRVDGPALVFEQERKDDKTGEPNNRWDVCYRAKVTLTVRDAKGNVVCTYEGSATATAENQKRGEAHSLALKSAESTALKRAATNLGDQFGLSLYNKGQTRGLVLGTIVKPGGFAPAERPDLQDNIPAQVSLGNEEGGDDPETETGPPLNQDGSLSRSRMTDEELAAAGSMTKAQVKEHTALINEVQGRKGEEVAERADMWTEGPPNPEVVALFRSQKNEQLTRPQQAKIHTLFGAAGWSARDDRIRAVRILVGREVESTSDLNREEAKAVIDVLDIVTKAPDPSGLLTDYLAATKAEDRDEMARVLTVAAKASS
jgi:hypothetical protein